MKKKTPEERAAKKQNKEKSVLQKIWKAVVILLKILRWPAVYIGVPFAGTYGFYGIVNWIQGTNEPIYTIVGKFSMPLGTVLVILVLLAGIATSSLFTETFLASTGIAAGLYLFTSLFISAPYSWGTDYVDFDTMKMFVFLILTGSVLLGDVIVLVFRKILRKKSMRHMMERT